MFPTRTPVTHTCAFRMDSDLSAMRQRMGVLEGALKARDREVERLCRALEVAQAAEAEVCTRGHPGVLNCQQHRQTKALLNPLCNPSCKCHLPSDAISVPLAFPLDWVHLSGTLMSSVLSLSHALFPPSLPPVILPRLILPPCALPSLPPCSSPPAKRRSRPPPGRWTSTSPP